MSILRVGITKGAISEHYEWGMQKILPLPIKYATDYPVELHKEFFAYLSTLGGGLVGGDKYEQEFYVIDSKAALSSQSSQKIYKGSSTLRTKLKVDKGSVLVFHNDANIFYPNSNFNCKTTIYADKQSSFFYLDGGFIGYAKGEFSTLMSCRIFVDYKLILNDVFYYDYKRSDLNGLFNHEYFYTIFIKGDANFNCLQEDGLKAHSSCVNGVNVIRIVSDDNDKAMAYISEIKADFLRKNNMNYIAARG